MIDRGDRLAASLRPLLLAFVALVVACSDDSDTDGQATATETGQRVTTESTPTGTPSDLADVIAVEVVGEPGGYTFAVTVASLDTGCERYADWWEVLTADGDLLYRRVLLHSHVDEQPFSRSGGPVPVEPDTELVICAHMNIGGYGGGALRGSAGSGFTLAELAAGFAAEVETLPPQPDGCDF